MSWAESPHQASWAYSNTGLTDVKCTDHGARAGTVVIVVFGCGGRGKFFALPCHKRSPHGPFR